MELLQLKKKGTKFFIFDLSDTEWIDSMGISSIFAAGKISEAFGRKAVVIGCNEKINHSISLAKLDRWIRISDSMDEARNYLEF